jgi:hypothetical protein
MFKFILHMLAVHGLIALFFLFATFCCSTEAQTVLQGARSAATVGQISGLYLVDANTNLPIRLLRNDSVINVAFKVTSHFNIEARTTNGTVGSVKFGYQSNPDFRTESYPPYAFCGDKEAKYYLCDVLVKGKHKITATPFLNPLSKGPAGAPFQVTFSIIDSPSTPTKAPIKAPTKSPIQPPISCSTPRVCINW